MIVMDLEWNYGTTEQSAPAEKSLKFEIIQIGAAKVDAQGKILKTFDRLVGPSVYPKMASHVEKLTGITEQRLSGAQKFPTVWKAFCDWSGGEQQIIFWGNCDGAVLLSNLLYHGFSGGEDLELYDLQALYDCAFVKSGQQTALGGALGALELTPYGQYHSALADAVNAASIFKSLGGEEFIRQNQPKLMQLLARRHRKKVQREEPGELLMEKTLENITDIDQVQPQFEPQLHRYMNAAPKQLIEGFYRNHKKIWAYQCEDRFVKVTSRSRPARSGRGKDFIVRFYQIDRAQLDALRRLKVRQETQVRRRRR